MLAVRHRPEAITAKLLELVRPLVRYDADGRFSVYLVEGGKLPAELESVARAVCPDGSFSFVALQAYRDGNAVTPCHADLGSSGFILSIGATRTFRVHRAEVACDFDPDAVEIECINGTAIVMDEAFHATWHHRVMPDAVVTGERLSLVFRR